MLNVSELSFNEILNNSKELNMSPNKYRLSFNSNACFEESINKPETEIDVKYVDSKNESISPSQNLNLNINVDIKSLQCYLSQEINTKLHSLLDNNESDMDNINVGKCKTKRKKKKSMHETPYQKVKHKKKRDSIEPDDRIIRNQVEIGDADGKNKKNKKKKKSKDTSTIVENLENYPKIKHERKRKKKMLDSNDYADQIVEDQLVNDDIVGSSNKKIKKKKKSDPNIIIENQERLDKEKRKKKKHKKHLYVDEADSTNQIVEHQIVIDNIAGSSNKIFKKKKKSEHNIINEKKPSGDDIIENLDGFHEEKSKKEKHKKSMDSSADQMKINDAPENSTKKKKKKTSENNHTIIENSSNNHEENIDLNESEFQILEEQSYKKKCKKNKKKSKVNPVIELGDYHQDNHKKNKHKKNIELNDEIIIKPKKLKKKKTLKENNDLAQIDQLFENIGNDNTEQMVNVNKSTEKLEIFDALDHDMPSNEEIIKKHKKKKKQLKDDEDLKQMKIFNVLHNDISSNEEIVKKHKKKKKLLRDNEYEDLEHVKPKNKKHNSEMAEEETALDKHKKLKLHSVSLIEDCAASNSTFSEKEFYVRNIDEEFASKKKKRKHNLDLDNANITNIEDEETPVKKRKSKAINLDNSSKDVFGIKDIKKERISINYPDIFKNNESPNRSMNESMTSVEKPEDICEESVFLNKEIKKEVTSIDVSFEEEEEQECGIKMFECVEEKHKITNIEDVIIETVTKSKMVTTKEKKSKENEDNKELSEIEPLKTSKMVTTKENKSKEIEHNKELSEIGSKKIEIYKSKHKSIHTEIEKQVILDENLNISKEDQRKTKESPVTNDIIRNNEGSQELFNSSVESENEALQIEYKPEENLSLTENHIYKSLQENDFSSSDEEFFEDDKKNLQQIQMLENLNVFLDFEVPLSHTIETRMSSCPNKEQNQRFKDLNLQMKKGPYTKEEDAKIKENWITFCKRHDIEDNPEPFLTFKHPTHHKNTSVLKQEQRQQFVRYLAKGLNDRMLFSVFQRFRKLHMNETKGRFTAQEDKVLVDYMKNIDVSVYGKHFTEVGKILNRSNLSVEKRFKKLQEAFQYDHARNEKLDIDEVIQYMMEHLQVKSVNDLNNKEIHMPTWVYVGNKMNVPPSKIMRTWNSTVHPQLFVEGTRSRFELRKKLLGILRETGINDYRAIKWATLLPHFPGFTTLSLYKLFKKLYEYVPDRYKINLKDCVEYLSLRYSSETKDEGVIYKLELINGKYILCL